MARGTLAGVTGRPLRAGVSCGGKTKVPLACYFFGSAKKRRATRSCLDYPCKDRLATVSSPPVAGRMPGQRTARRNVRFLSRPSGWRAEGKRVRAAREHRSHREGVGRRLADRTRVTVRTQVGRL